MPYPQWITEGLIHGTQGNVVDYEFVKARLLADAKDYLDMATHWALAPGMAIFLTVLAINFIGDGLRDALDPRRVI